MTQEQIDDIKAECQKLMNIPRPCTGPSCPGCLAGKSANRILNIVKQVQAS